MSVTGTISLPVVRLFEPFINLTSSEAVKVISYPIVQNKVFMPFLEGYRTELNLYCPVSTIVHVSVRTGYCNKPTDVGIRVRYVLVDINTEDGN